MHGGEGVRGKGGFSQLTSMYEGGKVHATFTIARNTPISTLLLASPSSALPSCPWFLA